MDPLTRGAGPGSQLQVRPKRGGYVAFYPIYGSAWLKSNNLCEVVSKNFHVPLNTLCTVRTVKWGGGGDWGFWAYSLTLPQGVELFV